LRSGRTDRCCACPNRYSGRSDWVPGFDERHGKSSDECVTGTSRIYYFDLWGIYSGYFLVNPNFASVSAQGGYEDRGATITELLCFVSVDHNYISQWKNLRRNFVERRWIEYNKGRRRRSKNRGGSGGFCGHFTLQEQYICRCDLSSRCFYSRSVKLTVCSSHHDN
jgi:hypothetical protein